MQNVVFTPNLYEFSSAPSKRRLRGVLLDSYGNIIKSCFSGQQLLHYNFTWKWIGYWWPSRTSNPVCRVNSLAGGFDSHALPPLPSFYLLDNQFQHRQFLSYPCMNVVMYVHPFQPGAGLSICHAVSPVSEASFPSRGNPISSRCSR